MIGKMEGISGANSKSENFRINFEKKCLESFVDTIEHGRPSFLDREKVMRYIK